MSGGRAIRLGTGALALLSFAAASAADAPPPRAVSIESGLVERTRVSLLLLDVRVTDEEGRPLRGLGPGDFEVRLDRRDWPLVSVDDLCGCADASVARGPWIGGQPSAASAQAPEVPGEAPPVTPEPPRFVMHLDFAQLQLDGRHNATQEAERWVRETMQPDDFVMLTAYSSQTGLVVLADFTRDRERLVSAIRDAYAGTRFRDPFPDSYTRRASECQKCCGLDSCDCDFCWQRLARTEYVQSKNALEAVGQLLERLQGSGERKALLLFNQRGTLFPSRYTPVDTFTSSNHLSLVDRLAAEAALARTSIYTAFAGDAENPEAHSLGANLADMTGGRYSRRIEEITALTAGAGRGCECIYRLALTPPEREGHVYRAHVLVRGRPVDGSHRVVYLGEAERWMRAARAVLSSPESAQGVPFSAALVPVAGRKQGWEVRVQVAVDPSTLELLPVGAKLRGDWEVGALLVREHGRTWEMLGISELSRDGGEGMLPVTILHERTFDELPPGRYELRAFVRDRLANLYGGSQVSLELPDVTREGFAGPVVLRSGRPLLPTSLPLRVNAKKVEEPTRERKVIPQGTLPLAHAVAPGEALEFLSCICPGRAKDSLWSTRRWVAREGVPQFRFADAEPVRAGDCALLRDGLDTTALPAGDYTYHVRWRPDPEGEPREVEAPFELAVESVDPPAPDPPNAREN